MACKYWISEHSSFKSQYRFQLLKKLHLPNRKVQIKEQGMYFNVKIYIQNGLVKLGVDESRVYDCAAH